MEATAQQRHRIDLMNENRKPTSEILWRLASAHQSAFPVEVEFCRDTQSVRSIGSTRGPRPRDRNSRISCA